MNRKIENKIVKKIKVVFKLEAALPLIIGSGENEYADIEIIKDKNKKLFIPGTAIAGVMRHYVDNPKVFNDERLSPIYTYDCEISDGNISIRDGVKLNENKVSENTAKYDYEIVESGAKIDVMIDIFIREKNLNDNSKYPQEREIIQCVDKFIWGIEHGEVYIGAKTKRGFGRVSLVEGSLKVEGDTFERAEYTPKYDTLKVELDLQGGIMVRKYNDTPGEADYIHIKSGKNSIIPGTTWNGAIRHRTEEVLKGLGKHNIKFIEKVFGKETDEGQASLIIFEESILNGGERLLQTRVKIDRFTGGAVDSALYTEEPHYTGKTVLTIKFPKGQNYIIGLLLPALEDLCNGFLAVGGETSIGRGIFQNGRILLNGDLLEDKDIYYRELLKEVDKYVE